MWFGVLYLGVPVLTGAVMAHSGGTVCTIYRTLLDQIIDQCHREMQAKWIDKLAGVDVFGWSNCRAMLVYVRWDD